MATRIYPEGEWINNWNSSFEEQIVECKRAIENYTMMISNNHPNSSSMKSERDYWQKRLGTINELLSAPRLGVLESKECKRIVYELIETITKGTLQANPRVSWTGILAKCKRVEHKFPNIKNSVCAVFSFWSYDMV